MRTSHSRASDPRPMVRVVRHQGARRLPLASPLPVLVLTALLLALPGAAAGQATPYVPNLDPAYEDLDVLVGAGLVQDVIVGERPHSRAAFRRFIGEAARRAEREPPSARLLEALARLEARFMGPAEAEASRRAPLRAADARLDLVVPRSPDRRLETGSDGALDAALNPLLQRNQGRTLVDGVNAAGEATVELEAGFVAGALTPRVYLTAPRGDAEADVSGHVLTAYGRAVVGPVALDLGRNNVSFGYGVDGGPILSHNARGLDMARVAADRPVRLPGPLGVLGLWQASLALADMGNARDVPGAHLALIRLSGRPSRYVEFGFNYLNLQGGEGAPEASFNERVQDIFFFWQDGGFFQISDKVAGADLRISVPEIRSALYVNFLTTDDRGRFQQPAGGYWEDAIWLVGAEVEGLGREGRVDLGMEWRHAGARAHTHGQFTSGVTVDDRVLGEPMGPNAAGVSAVVGWTGPESRLRVSGAWERYSGDDFYWARIDGGGPWDFDWFLGSDNPDEIRVRLVADYLRFQGWRGLETSLRLGYERVTRFAFTEEDRNNFLAELSLRHRW